ncbi:MAG: hypothetical protein LBE18_07850 [Planctomycetaceae bacterium]|jgi:hypothetical protein|nr:hypothetical protein [Planctomycetaceae bacterium]
MKKIFNQIKLVSVRFDIVINCTLLVAILIFMTGVNNTLFAQQSAFPIERLHTDWLYQDIGLNIADCFVSSDNNETETKLLNKVFSDIEKLGLNEAETEQFQSFKSRFNQLTESKLSGKEPQWKSLYLDTANLRRIKRLNILPQRTPQLVYTKHCILGGSHYAYTENVTDAQMPEKGAHNRDWRVGAALCLLKINADGTTTSEVLHETKTGIIRDPDISYDGKNILFSMRQNVDSDDFHIYEYNIDTKNIKQLTHGTGFADIEPCCLPDGNIIFASTRCTQIVDCWWTEVSNLYLIDKEGRFMRRIGFDQVHTNYPTTTEDGRILYTRWDYNDRGQLFPQPLFQMNYDGTAQTEFYGNNSWFPTTILHARMIPGSQKVVAIASGHHTRQRGKLILIDRNKGTQEAEGVQLIAPKQETKSVQIDQYGQGGDQFQYPYPIDENHFLVTYQPEGFKNNNFKPPFGVYLTDIDGNRELLAFDPSISSCQQIPLVKRNVPTLRASAVDYTKETGQYYVQDIYEGPGLKGVERGTVKAIRIVALEFRAAGIRPGNYNRGPGGSADISTPIAIDNGSWDVKRVIGNVPVEKDGSAYFEVPARTPVFFQMLDEKGKVIQTMRSWSTLQPGELFSCIGCHENKNETPFNKDRETPVSKLALRSAPKKPVPFIATDRGFSFTLDVQPILNKYCISCHNGEEQKLADGSSKTPFSLLEKPYEPKPKERFHRAGRNFSEAYINLVKNGRPNEIVNWLNVQSIPPMILPCTPDSPVSSSNHYTGSAKSKLISMLETGHNDVKLSPREIEILSCWIDLAVPYCGSYTESNTWNDDQKAEYAYYLNKRNRMENIDKENIKKLLEFKKTSILPDVSLFRTPDIGGINVKKDFKKSFLEKIKEQK